MDDQVADYLVPDVHVQREFSITAMTLWRWTRDPELGFPPAISIKNRNYRSRAALEAFKSRIIAEALRTRPDPAAWEASREARAARREARRQTAE